MRPAIAKVTTTLRLPEDVKNFLHEQARLNCSSESSEAVRAVRERMERLEASSARNQSAA